MENEASFGGVADYGPEIIPGARVMSATGRRGTVVSVEDRCHWCCDESAAQWRPRSAYVEWDDHGAGACYESPESLARIPASWGRGIGVIRQDSTNGDKRPFCATVVRLLVFSEATVSAQWHIMNRQTRGWGESSIYYTSWQSLLAEWDIERGEPAQDESGWFIPVSTRRVKGVKE